MLGVCGGSPEGYGTVLEVLATEDSGEKGSSSVEFEFELLSTAILRTMLVIAS